MQISDNGKSNPLVIISPDEVTAWLRQKCDEAGFKDRELCMVQINVETPFQGGNNYHWEPPQLVAMVSNIKDSRR